MTKPHIAILRKIIDSQSHHACVDDAREAIETLRENINNGVDGFTLDFNGNEYRIISEDAIWDIYVETIRDIVTDCYELNLDKLPGFIALSIDWEKTAKNACVDGYGHTFSSYDGSEERAGGYHIFRTN